MAFDKISAFHPNPQVRRKREAAMSEGGGHADNEGLHGAEDRPEKPAKMVEIHRHEDGSAHTITHHADGKKEKTEHASHEEAQEHAARMQHADGSDGMEHEGGDEGMQSEEQEPCPDCGGEGCEACGGTGIKKSEGEEY